MAEDSESAGSELPASDNSRDDVAAAFDAVEARDAPADAPATDAPAAAPADPAAVPPLEGRDALGRFAPKRAETPGGTPPQPAPSPAPPVPQPGEPAAPHTEPPRHLAKAPASWSPQEAAHWEKAPLEVREAIARRENETQRVMQESAQARAGLSTLQQVISPYLSNIQAANGGDAVTAIRTFFDFDNTLRHGTQIEKAKAATRLIKGYGIDIATLDNELAGAPHAPEQTQQTAIQQALARELGPIRQHLAQQEQARQQAEEESHLALARDVDAGLTAFAKDAAHPHYDTVRADMADLLEIATHQGRKLSLQDAYDRACWQSPAIRGILIAGQQSAGAQAQHQAAQRARAAAVGVRNAPRAGAPANATPSENRSRADDIAAAFAAHAGEA